MVKNPMSDEAREALNAYKREWNRNNPEKRRAQQRRYWERKAQEKREQQEAKPNGQADRESREAGCL